MPRNLLEIPKKGISHEELLNILDNEMRADDIKPTSGKSFGLCYLAGEEHTEFLKKAYTNYFLENGLNAQAYPSLNTMENEIVAMTAWMLNGTRKVSGNITSGGTESILNAMKAYRDWARETKHIKEPEMIIPETAHPAFDKAGHYFDMKVVHAPIREDLRLDVQKVREDINENTAVMVGSAVCYPYGVIDPIEELGVIAEENDIGLHIDACLGGFILPWCEKLGYPLYCNWDFRVPGVTSISADAHKYGYAAKPASVILYRNDNFRKYQYYIYADWCGGIYGTPTLPGTRPGGAIAACWAALKALGQDGFLASTKDTMETAMKIMDGINSIEGLHVVGKPDTAIYAYTFDDDVKLNFFELIDIMQGKGWNINRMQNPPAAHHMTSHVHIPIVNEFLNDLHESLEELKSRPPSDKLEGQAAMYNMMAEINDEGKIEEIVRDILLQTYKYTPSKKSK